MELPTARKNLNAQLGNATTFGEFVKKDWKAAEKLIWDWWHAFKDEERKDTFSQAFYQNRIAMRTWSDTMTKAHILRLAGNRIWEGNPTPPKDKIMIWEGSGHAEKGTKLMDDFDKKDFKFSVGLDSMAKRTDPSNFCPGPGTASRKYEEGLHDMSSTLVDCRRPISEQSHMKDDGTIFSFVALSDPADQAVFYNLNRIAKSMRNEHLDFYNTVREFRAKMTRVKLAAEHDMGTGFTAVRRENGESFKLKYGLGYTTKIIDEKKSKMDEKFGGKLGGGTLGTGVRVTEKMWQERRDAALDYQSILKRQLFPKNEITVAIRQHAGPFPFFATYQAKEGRFACFSIQEGKKVAEKDQYIQDNMPLKNEGV